MLSNASRMKRLRLPRGTAAALLLFKEAPTMPYSVEHSRIYEEFQLPLLAAVLIQPLAMYLFLRILEYGFFPSAGLSALSATLIGFAVMRLTASKSI